MKTEEKREIMTGTHDKRIEELQREIDELHRKTEFYEAALDALPNPVFIKDEKGDFLFLNDSYRKFFDLQQNNADDIVGADLPHLYPVENEQYETRFTDSEGNIREALYWTKDYATQRTRQRGVVGEIVEITEEKRLQRELARYIAFQKDIMNEAKQSSWRDAVTGLLNRRAFAEQLPDGRAVTISLGVAQLKADEEPMAFLSRADEALYRAKNSGKNRVVAAG